MTYSSIADDAEWNPILSQIGLGFLSVRESMHRIFYHEYGNPHGEPVFFFHGGPGGGTTEKDARYFDPQRYHIILFDQRGCGKSTPCAATHPKEALRNNTTADLISDINELRSNLGIKGKMHIFGGSWGSTLALAYAEAFPKNVESLTLRGIFLCRKQDLDYLYQGNAAEPENINIPGAYQFRPEAWKNFKEMMPPDVLAEFKTAYDEAWKKFVEVIPKEERSDMVAAYAAILANPNHPKYEKAALAWSYWEGITSFVAPSLDKLDKFKDPEFAKAFARIENHYFMGAFAGERDNNVILDNVPNMLKINPALPINIVHGEYDQVCPRNQADALVARLNECGATNVHYKLTAAGHSATERENMQALTEIMHSEVKIPRMKPQ